MIVNMLKCKLHRATVTQCDLHYEGSLTVDPLLLRAAGLLVHEQIDVLNITNGQRFTTYVIEGEESSGMIGVNGAAARLAQKGDQVIICAYAQMERAAAESYQPVVVLLGDGNKIKDIVDGSGGKDMVEQAA